jgi:hypothetical protein
MKRLLSITLALLFACMLSGAFANSQIQIRVKPEHRERHHVVYNHHPRAHLRVSQPMRHHAVRPQMENRNEVRHENH